MRNFKTLLAPLALAAVCLTAGCSNVTQIYETDERLHTQTETGFEEVFTTIDARAAVYDGEYETFDIPGELNIAEMIAPIGDNRFVVFAEEYFEDGVYNYRGEYGIYTLGGEYKALFPKSSTDDSPKTASEILYCNDEYILYYKEVLNDYGTIASTELVDVYLLRLEDMTEKRIYRIMPSYFPSVAVISGNAVYLECREEPKSFSGSEDKVMYDSSTIVRYDIEKEELEDFCSCAGAPTIYKDKLAFYVGDGTFVSQAEPLFLPAEYGLTAKSLEIFPSDEMAYSYYDSAEDQDYTMLGYIRDGKPFNIFRANDIVSVYNVSFSDGYAVWDCNFFTGWPSKSFPMFYSDEKKSVIVIEDERSDYDSCIHNGRIYFFEKNEYDFGYKRAIVLDTKNIK